jgi:hypothetical protein
LASEAGLQGGIGGERRVQGSVDRGELALDLAQTRSDLTLEQRRAVRVVAVAGGNPVLDQGATSAVQFLHGVDGRAHYGPHRRLEQRREAGKHGGVDRVGFGMPADRLGEAAARRGSTLTSGRPAAARRRSRAW